MRELYELAPEGTIYVCGCCGKTSRNRAGFWPNDGVASPTKNGERLASHGWDESCMLHAVLCKQKAPGDTGPWQAVPELRLVTTSEDPNLQKDQRP